MAVLAQVGVTDLIVAALAGGLVLGLIVYFGSGRNKDMADTTLATAQARREDVDMIAQFQAIANQAVKASMGARDEAAAANTRAASAEAEASKARTEAAEARQKLAEAQEKASIERHDLREKVLQRDAKITVLERTVASQAARIETLETQMNGMERRRA